MASAHGSHMDLTLQCLRKNFPGFTLDNTYQKLTTGLVFHTWVSADKRGIPDGTYLVDGVYLNYVAKLKLQARELEAEGIPVMIVYSRLSLPRVEETKMIFAFREERNIVLLCLEDMLDVIPFETYQYFYGVGDLMINLPIAVITHAKDVVQRLWRTACNEGKRNYAMSLDQNGGNAIMYLDMDMVFTAKKVPVVYAKNGMCTWPELNGLFTYERYTTNNLDTKMLKIAESHAAVFRKGWKDIIQYVLSGKAYDTANRLAKACGRSVKPAIAKGRASMILVSYSETSRFRDMSFGCCGLDDLHTPPMFSDEYTSDPLYRENHTLVYLQLVPYMERSVDHAWMSEDTAWMSE